MTCYFCCGAHTTALFIIIYDLKLTKHGMPLVNTPDLLLRIIEYILPADGMDGLDI